MGLDRRVFVAINHWPEWLAPAMRFFSTALDVWWMKGILIVILVALLAAGKDTRRGAIVALVAWPLANLSTDLFKHGFPSLRPCNDPALTDCILRIGATNSSGTASAHSANMMAVAVAFLWTLRGFGAPWLVLAILVGISRVYNGVHYPWHVLLGWTLGALVATGVAFGERAIERRWIARRGSGEAADATA